MELVRDTFILIAEDCPATTGAVPLPRGDKPTVAALEYAFLAAAPYTLTHRELVLRVEARRRGLPDDLASDEKAALEAELFAKPRACMRASPLPKSYGWGVHHDGEGRIGLAAAGSPEYARLAAAAPTVVKAMRSKRA